MANWIKRMLFGRQLSHGSDVEEPKSLEEAFQHEQVVPVEPQANIAAPPPPVFQTQTSIGTGEASPGGQEMQAAYKVSNVLVRERIQREAPEDIEILDNIKDTDIICVRGTYDHIHLVLAAIEVPFAQVTPEKLLNMELKPEQTIYVNCPNSFPEISAKKLAKFVEDGGMLITTDWALKNVIEVAFPGTVQFNGKHTGDEVVAIEIIDKEDEILKGFIDQEKDAAPVWWLEGSSYPIKVLDSEKVKVLVRSDELKRRYGCDPVIISFEWGKGIVYHMISHFYLQRSETRTQKQATSGSSYAKAQGASSITVAMYEEMDEMCPEMNYGAVQSAATSSEFVSRALVKQKKRFLNKK